MIGSSSRNTVPELDFAVCQTTRVVPGTSQCVSIRPPTPRLISTFLVFCLFITVLSGCGGVAGIGNGVSSASTPTSQLAHVFLLVEENHSYSSVIGNSSMPYLNGLASKYGVATQYFADTHPSIGNYFMLTTGQIITNDDSFGGTVNADNIVRHLIAAGKTWRSYAESLPANGYMADGPYPYAKNHNPFPYFSDVVNSSTQTANLVPFSQFPTDLSSGQLPDFSLIVPNLQNDAHDGTLGQADAWLQQNIAPLISNPVFQNSLLIIVFDESDLTDWDNGGGHVAALIISPKAKSGYKSTTTYQHQSTLRLILRALGISSFPGAAAGAADMSEFF